MTVPEPIKITGLREFQRALKNMDGESQKKIRLVLNEVAETVSTGASRRVPTKTGRARSTLRAQSSQREARVVAGGKKATYYGWLDFGGTVGRGRISGTAKKRAGAQEGSRAGSVKRTWIASGRYIYPAYAANRDSIHKALDKSLADLVREAGLEVRSDA